MTISPRSCARSGSTTCGRFGKLSAATTGGRAGACRDRRAPPAEDSWAVRRALYESLFSEPGTLVLIAELGSSPVGYALVHIRGPEETWSTGDHVAELETLAVLPKSRRGTSALRSSRRSSPSSAPSVSGSGRSGRSPPIPMRSASTSASTCSRSWSLSSETCPRADRAPYAFGPCDPCPEGPPEANCRSRPRI